MPLNVDGFVVGSGQSSWNHRFIEGDVVLPGVSLDAPVGNPAMLRGGEFVSPFDRSVVDGPDDLLLGAAKEHRRFPRRQITPRFRQLPVLAGPFEIEDRVHGGTISFVSV